MINGYGYLWQGLDIFLDINEILIYSTWYFLSHSQVILPKIMQIDCISIYYFGIIANTDKTDYIVGKLDGTLVDTAVTKVVTPTHRSAKYTVLLTFLTAFWSVSCLDADIRYRMQRRIETINGPIYLILQSDTVSIDQGMQEESWIDYRVLVHCCVFYFFCWFLMPLSYDLLWFGWLIFD